VGITTHVPVAPREFPPARTVLVPDRGEFFVRDSGWGPGERAAAARTLPVVFMLHGWTGSADLNFGGLYEDVSAAGYRLVALDHRGHGRGPRPLEPFRLADCAADAAAVIRALDLAPVIVYGYSMGGAIAQLLARDYPNVVAAMVLSGTAQHWQEPELRRVWRAMPLVGAALALAPLRGWQLLLRRSGFRPGPATAWVHSEMTRHSARDIAEAGRELGRFDSRPWLAPLPFPTAVVLTSEDDAVPPAKQRELAHTLGAQIFEAPVRHLDVAAMAPAAAARRYNPALIAALDALRAGAPSGRLSGDEP
jgi:3-oxoadipate enol-lactonase